VHAVAALLVCVNLSKNFCLRIRLEAKASAKVMGLSEICKYFEDIFSKIMHFYHIFDLGQVYSIKIE
jgi:hypothetical protein